MRKSSYPVHAAVFGKILIETGDGSEEYDSIRVIKVRIPSLTLERRSTKRLRSHL
jgi:hypothetical protein